MLCYIIENVWAPITISLIMLRLFLFKFVTLHLNYCFETGTENYEYMVHLNLNKLTLRTMLLSLDN